VKYITLFIVLLFAGSTLAQTGPTEKALKECDAYVATSLSEYSKTYNGKEVMTFLKSTNKKVNLKMKNYNRSVKTVQSSGAPVHVVIYSHKQMLNLHEFPERFCVKLDKEGEVIEMVKKGKCE